MRQTLTLVFAVLLVVTTVGCAGLVGSTRGGLVRATVVSSVPSGSDSIPLSEVDNDRLQRATEQAVTVYESNGTAEIAAVTVPKSELDETRDAYERLPQRPDGEVGRFVTHRGYSVRISLIIYTE